MHGEVRNRLDDAVRAAHQGMGKYGYYIDHNGDGQSGDCIYSSGGDTMSCPYTMDTVGGKAATHLDTENAKKVQPHVSYEEVADDDDHYASMEAQKLYADLDSSKLRETIPVFERFISKAERAAADEGNFAGKGKSYPILKPKDVGAAVHAMGRAGSGNYGMAQLKSNIVRIAKKKGWTNELPKEWRDGATTSESLREASKSKAKVATAAAVMATQAAHDATDAADSEKTKEAYKKAGKAHQDAASAHYEAAALQYGTGDEEAGREHVTKAIKHQTKAGQLNENGFAQTASTEGQSSGLALAADEVPIREGAAFCEALPIVEAARTDYPIKIITPGWGSTGYYSPEILERDAKIFKPGTQMFWDHATEAEENARPEGRMDDLAAVTTSEAKWEPAGKDGPGIYARAKVFSDYADKVAEKGPHTGLSIRAAGRAKLGEAEGRKGLIIEALTHAQSIDFVTKAGRGGQVLTESAGGSPIQTEEAAEMTAAELQEIKALREAAQNNAAELKRLRERQATLDAQTAIADYFDTSKGGVAVGPVIQRSVARYMESRALPLNADGSLDVAKLKESLKTATQEEADWYFKQTGRKVVIGQGASGQPTVLSEADKLAQETRLKEARKEWGKTFALTMGFRPEQKMARKIMVEGRGAFDYNYNSADHGAKVTGAGVALEG